MATAAVLGSQTTISYWSTTASPNAYTAYSEVKSISDFGSKRPRIDVTTLESTAVEYIGGLRDGDDITLEMNANSTNHDLVIGQVDAGTKLDFRVDFTSAGLTETKYFSVIPLSWNYGKIEPKKEITIMLKGSITGAISATNPHA